MIGTGREPSGCGYRMPRHAVDHLADDRPVLRTTYTVGIRTLSPPGRVEPGVRYWNAPVVGADTVIVRHANVDDANEVVAVPPASRPSCPCSTASPSGRRATVVGSRRTR